MLLHIQPIPSAKIQNDDATTVYLQNPGYSCNNRITPIERRMPMPTCWCQSSPSERYISVHETENTISIYFKFKSYDVTVLSTEIEILLRLHSAEKR